MKPGKTAWPTLILAAAVTVAAIGASAAPPAPAESPSEKRLCCVANQRFAGKCAVELGPKETCADVLAYLNNANSVGRTYCGGTDIRMGWAQVDCQD